MIDIPIGNEFRDTQDAERFESAAAYPDVPIREMYEKLGFSTDNPLFEAEPWFEKNPDEVSYLRPDLWQQRRDYFEQLGLKTGTIAELRDSLIEKFKFDSQGMADHLEILFHHTDTYHQILLFDFKDKESMITIEIGYQLFIAESYYLSGDTASCLNSLQFLAEMIKNEHPSDNLLRYVESIVAMIERDLSHPPQSAA